MTISQPIINKIADRLARDEDWRESAFGQALALTIDTQVVSLKVLADYLTIKERGLYRALVSKSGQPPSRKYYPDVFDSRCLQYTAALAAAHAKNAFANIGSWKGGDKRNSARDNAHRILLSYTPDEPQ